MSPRDKTEKAGWIALQLARAYIKKEFPYFYKTLIALTPKHIPNIGTLYVSRRWVMGIDMVWFSTLPVEIAGGCLIHEVMHILRDLSRIYALPNPRLAGYAFDIPINDDLKKFGIKLPDWVVYSEKHGFPPGLPGEKYYELLKNTKLPPLGLGAGACGSCSGTPHEIEVEFEEVDEADGRTDDDIQYFKRQGAQDVRDFLKSKGITAGNASGSWKEFLEFNHEKPIVPWQRMVKMKALNCMGRSIKGQSDYSLRHPAKRSYSMRFLRPGLISISSDTPIVVIEDSSGSMQKDMLKEGRVEIAGAMDQLGLTHAWFLNADVEVQTRPKLVTVNELKTLPVVGRGGTAFSPAIEAIMKLRPKPKMVFYSTDGGAIDSNKIEQPKGVEFIWLLVPSAYTCRPCSWGTQILLSNDREERKRFEKLQ